MAQYQAYRNPRPSAEQVPFLLDLQSDIVTIDSRLVAPLVDAEVFGPRLTRLHPAFIVADRRVILASPDLAGLPARELCDWVADLSAERDTIFGAIDFLLTGT
ncbi:CcdB family protein [Spectribacter hydrogenooxidans]|uniref:Toxin CcdB n=1 Tax=Spectribacter hydrogenoxidans TaxID=3075608 RepID=A0ABU3BZT5_9GAMM|nr:CcdB family protein [Salinisphaera sp. W335]MDT0634809.1 CcdB family protein [Salinisphaera sp. W335]